MPVHTGRRVGFRPRCPVGNLSHEPVCLVNGFWLGRMWCHGLWLLDDLWLLEGFFWRLLWKGDDVGSCRFRCLPPCWAVCPIRSRVAVFGFMAHFVTCFTGVSYVCVEGYWGYLIYICFPTVTEEMARVATAETWSCHFWYSLLICVGDVSTLWMPVNGVESGLANPFNSIYRSRCCTIVSYGAVSRRALLRTRFRWTGIFA